MTDRERPARPDHSFATGHQTAPGLGAPTVELLVSTASSGDGPPMPLTLSPSRTPGTDRPPVSPIYRLLERLGSADDPLPSFHVPPLPVGQCPPGLADAVARAAACPDLFLVHTPDHGTGERVIVEVARCRPDERVLILTPDPAAADRITEALVQAGETELVRALGPDETPANTPETVAGLTSPALLTASVEQIRQEAEATVAAADARLTLIERLCDNRERADRLAQEVVAVTAHRSAVASAVRAATEAPSDMPFVTRLAQLDAEYRALTDTLTARLSDLERAVGELEAKLADLRTRHALAAADEARKPSLLGRLFGKPRPGPTTAECEELVRQAESERESLQARVEATREELAAAAARHAAEREAAIQAEIADRCRGFDERLAELAAEAERLDREADDLRRRVADLPVDCDLPAIRYGATRDLIVARERAAEAVRCAERAARSTLHMKRVVVGTPRALHADPALELSKHPDSPPFALLVLDRAEQLTEAAFLDLAGWASRWLLVGQVVRPELPAPEGSTSWTRPGRAPELPFATRLAHLADREPWACEGARLVCRLYHPTPCERRTLCREPLLDRPEIELRFVRTTAGHVALAEIAFPAGTTVAEAKRFVHEQLGLVLLRPCGLAHRHGDEATIRVCWPVVEQAGTDLCWVELEPGVREAGVGTGAGVFTAAVCFDRSAGWNEAQAEAWLAAHVPTTTSSRLAVLSDDCRSGPATAY